jgi:hypothetical protein
MNQNHIVMPPIEGFTVDVVAACQKKGADEGTGLIHVPAQGAEPEAWYVGRWRDGRWVESWQFGADLAHMQAACTKFVAVASEYVREFPSWADAAKPLVS